MALLDFSIKLTLKLQQPLIDMDRMEDWIVYVYLAKTAGEAVHDLHKMTQAAFTLTAVLRVPFAV